MTTTPEAQDAPDATSARLHNIHPCIFVPATPTLHEALPPTTNRAARLEAVLAMHDAHVAQVRANLIRLVERECVCLITSGAADEEADEKMRVEQAAQRQKMRQAEERQRQRQADEWSWRHDSAESSRLPAQRTAHPLPSRPFLPAAPPEDAEQKLGGGLSAAEFNTLVANVTAPASALPPDEPAPAPLPAIAFASHLSHLPSNSSSKATPPTSATNLSQTQARAAGPQSNHPLPLRQAITNSLFICADHGLKDLNNLDARQSIRRNRYQVLLAREMHDNATRSKAAFLLLLPIGVKALLNPTSANQKAQNRAFSGGKAGKPL